MITNEQRARETEIRMEKTFYDSTCAINCALALRAVVNDFTKQVEKLGRSWKEHREAELSQLTTAARSLQAKPLKGDRS